MAYFGGTGIRGEPLHTSLRAYIDCFLSSPFPKMYPRGGGVWDQDPGLMKDFRSIRKFDEDWQKSQQQMENAKHGQGGGGLAGLGGALEQYVESLDESGQY